MVDPRNANFEHYLPPCSYCDNGSFKDVIDGIPNHVRCDHCKGKGICPCDECDNTNFEIEF